MSPIVPCSWLMIAQLATSEPLPRPEPEGEVRSDVEVVENAVVPSRLLPGALGQRRVVLSVAEGTEVEFEAHLQPGASVETAGAATMERAPGSPGRTRWTLSVPFRAWDVGAHTGDPLRAQVAGSTVELDPAPYRVVSPLPPGTETRAASGPATGPPPRSLALPALIAGLLVSGGVLAGTRRHRRRHPGARTESALAGISMGAPDMVELARAARGHPAVVAAGVTESMTSEECALTCFGPDPDLADALHGLLSAADAVKFAGARIDPEQVERLHRRFLEAVRHAVP